MVISSVTAVLSVVALQPLTLRLLLGPLPPHVVTLVYYYNRTAITLIMTALTIKTFLIIAFLLDFNTMIGNCAEIARKIFNFQVSLISSLCP